ncbi:MAG: GLPGLI family protein [Prevotella sp.]|nr:GLPGLI family protein [Prevotella sp.]
MKTKLTVILLSVVNIMSAQMLTRDNEKLDTLCQTKFTAVYQYSINTSDAEGHPVSDSIRLALQVGDGVWKTWTYERYLFQQLRDGEIGDDHFWFMHNEALMHIATTTVGYPEGKTVTLESIPPFQYEVTEDMEIPTWNMVEGSDSVCGYLCQKANGKFRDKTWNVLYAEDIPTVAGPWKLQGLPGLITYAADDEGIHTFKLIGIYQETAPITYSAGSFVSEFSIEERRMRKTVKPYMKATREKMQKQKKTVFGNRIYLTNPMFYMAGAKEILHVGQKGGNYQFVGGLYVPDKAHKYQPLELK